MKSAIITVAGISSRFNEGIPEEEKKLKAVYYQDSSKNTLLYHLLQKNTYADRIILVGGYKFNELETYCSKLEPGILEKLSLVFNPHYEDLASGYSLYLGLAEAFRDPVDEILFTEGDIDIDNESFQKVVLAEENVLTFNYEPIYANKAVVLYRDDKNHFRYGFNSQHGLLCIDSPFSCILNSGQVWKFVDMEKLKAANGKFIIENEGGTNLYIIQDYINSCVNNNFDLIGLTRWTNCNTRSDYQKILSFWEAE